MSFLEEMHKPDILDCISHLSSDEVFTPPRLVNEILDTLPQELFKSSKTKFLDPCCKSGVFLREIAKRLIEGLKDEIPDLEKRIDHIFKNQLYGLAITELTALLSRRSVYCSKTADGEYSVCKFSDSQGNIEYKRTYHVWFKDKCMMCGASKAEYDRGEELETHAYSFIHTDEQRNSALFKRLKEMKFDVIIGNPPYQLDVGKVKDNYAIPIYQKFVEQAIKLNPKYITMIIPSRWFTGGRGLDSFRDRMLKDKRLRTIVDYSNSRDCFAGVDISGGVLYFLWDKDYTGLCEFTNINGNNKNTIHRQLDEYNIFPRYNNALTIIHKILSLAENTMNNSVSSQTPFGLYTNFTGVEQSEDTYEVLSSKGIQYVDKSKIVKNTNLISKYKVSFSKATTEHGGQVGQSGLRQVLSTIKLLKPGCICTQSYLLAGTYDSREEAENAILYLKTKFVRFLILQAITSQDISKEKFQFVPLQDFSEEWTDEKLYKKYGLTQEEIDFIESMIRPME